MGNIGNLSGIGKMENGGGGTSGLVWKKLYRSRSSTNFPLTYDSYIFILVDNTVTDFLSLRQYVINKGASDCLPAKSGKYAAQENSIPACGLYYKDDEPFKVTTLTVLRESSHSGTTPVSDNSWGNWGNYLYLKGEGNSSHSDTDLSVSINTAWSVVDV